MKTMQLFKAFSMKYHIHQNDTYLQKFIDLLIRYLYSKRRASYIYMGHKVNKCKELSLKMSHQPPKHYLQHIYFVIACDKLCFFFTHIIMIHSSVKMMKRHWLHKIDWRMIKNMISHDFQFLELYTLMCCSETSCYIVHIHAIIFYTKQSWKQNIL